MFKTRFISMLVLLMVAVTGAVAQSTYKVSVKEGTEDAEKWTIEPTEAAAGTQVTVTYSGLKNVKSVKAVKKAAAPAEEPATPQNTEGNLVHLTVNVGASSGSATNGSRANVNPSTGVISFSDGDKLYVGYNGACVGTLDYSATTNNTYKFSGDLNLTQSGDQPLHFYYLGGVVTQDGETQRYLVDISVQDENPYPVISYGTSTTNYSESSNAYSTTLENQCALVEFTTNRILKETNFYIKGINNRVTIDFANNTFTPSRYGSEQISLYPETPTSRWAILLPNEEPVTVTVDATSGGYNLKEITIPPVHKNDYLHGENAVSFELTAMDADKPLTMMAYEPATIHVINPPEGMKYDIGQGKQTINGESEISIDVSPGQEVHFYGNGTKIKNYSRTNIVSTNNVELSGNIMSLVDEENFATATSMAGASFAGLFAGNTCGINASSLLLPATTLSENCYSGMFAGCSELTDTPELPALTLAPGCYSNMFEGCDKLSDAPHLPATELVDRCYASMFYQCGTLENVTCLATTINGTDCTTEWLYEVNNPGTFTKASGSTWPEGSNGIPSGWTVEYYDDPINLTSTNGTEWTLTEMPDFDVVLQVDYDEVTLTDGEGITALNTCVGQEKWVNYTRSFTDGKTSTVCLPFAYTKKEGDGSFYAFTNIEKVGSEYVATMTEPGTTTLEANTPYLYLPNATGDVDFSGAYTIPAELTAGSTTSNGWTFKGTFETKEWTTAPTGIYGFSAQNVDEQGISQGQFVQVGEYVRVKPMRCYLQYGDGTSDWAGARGMTRAAEQLPETIKVRLISANGEVNAIGTISTKTGEGTIDNGAWYSLDGRRIEGKPSTKGVYINNGNKVIIK